MDHARIKVLIDGLKKLEMRLPLELPSGDEIYVTLEYEKLEKHCFICYSLSVMRRNLALLRGIKLPSWMSHKV